MKAEALRARHDRPVWLVMTIEDTRRNRSMLAPHRKLIESALHASSRAILRCLRTGEPLRSDGLLWVRPWRHLPEHDPGSTAPDPPADESRS